MVAHLFRLRLDLLRGAMRSERRTRTLLSLAAAIAVGALVCAGVLRLRDASTTVASTVIVLGAAAVFLAFLLAPILSGARDPLDPRRFVVFGVDERRMPAILALVGVISVPSAAVIAVAVCAALVMIEHTVPVHLAWMLTASGALTTLLAARIGMGIGAILLPERRPRELTALFVLAVVVIAFPAAIFLASQHWDVHIPDAVAALVLVAGFTPLAPAAASAFAIAAGDEVAAWATGVIAVLTLLGCWLLWEWVARHLLTATARQTTVRERSGLGWFAVLPAGAFGAIAARSLIYWLRDRRYLVNMFIVPVAGVLTALPLLVAGASEQLVIVVPVLVCALFLGWLPHNDVAYDSTAFWIHVASSVSGVWDRLGRLVPIVLVSAPVLAVGVSITLSLLDHWTLLPALVSVVACLFLSGLGLSSIVSVSAPYAVSRPGDSPFQQPQRSSGHGAFGHATALIGALVLSVPALWLFFLEMTEGRHTATVAAVGLGTGGGVLVVGVAVGALIYSRSGERLMEFVETN